MIKIMDIGFLFILHSPFLMLYSFSFPSSYNLLPQCLENDTNTQQAANLVEMLQETLLPRKSTSKRQIGITCCQPAHVSEFDD